MENGYSMLIIELDRTILTVRHLRNSSVDEDNREKWHNRLNQLLEERLRLMKHRDYAPRF